MPTIAEALAATNTPIADALDTGIDTLSGQQSIVFTKYVRLPLPLDGSVFWVRADLIGAAVLQNPSLVGPVAIPATATIIASGSLHRSTNRRQEENQTIGLNTIVFTSEIEIQPLSEINPVIMWLGTFEGVRFAFANRNSYYKQADVHHYVGEAVHPQMASQIVDDVSVLNNRQVVSNSLPIWLTMNSLCPIYASFLLPDNIPPPYAVVHVMPESTRAIQAMAYRAPDGTHWQLATEKVKITLIGLRNDAALDFLDMVTDYSLDTENIGIMNMPIVKDEKRIQVELATIAMAKSIEFEINYYQTRANNILRQYFKSVLPTFIPLELEVSYNGNN